MITALNPIPGKDRIELATVDGWTVIVKKGEFWVGGPCVYVEIDSVLPRWENNSSVSNTRGDVPVSKIRTILEQKFTHS